jgi:uracil-DNA glycosylase
VYALLIGEAPGPRGADKTEIPFWGDGAGRLVYRTLVGMGFAEIPSAAWEDWDGERLNANNVRPSIFGVGLTNAFPYCPTDDGQSFRHPLRRELASDDNVTRLTADVMVAARRCPGSLLLVTLGERARWTIDQLDPPCEFTVEHLPHPSSQGLLGAAESKGKGKKLADLEEDWAGRLKRVLSAQFQACSADGPLPSRQ